MNISITKYNACCNLGNNIDEIYKEALKGNSELFNLNNEIIKDKNIRIAEIKKELPAINEPDFNIRCNRLVLDVLIPLNNTIKELIDKYSSSRIGIAVATTNSGINEYENTNNILHSELGNPALFIKEYYGLNSFYISVSTACSSGIKAFSIAKNIIENDIVDAVIVVGVDPIANVPLFGFHSLEILTDTKTNPFSINRNGINLGEAAAAFIVEKEQPAGIKIMGIGETSDTYHATTPDPEGIETIRAINIALKESNLTPTDIDYINLHGTGTVSNDLMEARAINKVFGEIVPASSTKPMTGHCLGAAAGIEIALCCALLDNFEGKLYPHIYDGEYDTNLPKIKLVDKVEEYNKCNICMCNSFGFGGSNAILILGKSNE
ncbi:beta-ketoacyl-[bacterium]|nr:beta-ketoacyl-[acyl-carrier-protein] synthase II [bacterium]